MQNPLAVVAAHAYKKLQTLWNMEFMGLRYRMHKHYKRHITDDIKLNHRNKWKVRSRKQQIMRSLPKGHTKYYLKWLEAKGTYGQMPFSWMAYWYRR